MNALTTYDIAHAYATSFLNDRTVTHWVTGYYGQPFTAHVGTDMRRDPGTGDTPFIVLLPDSTGAGAENMKRQHELGIVVGIEDSEFTTRDRVIEMRGLVRLNELTPMLEKVMRMALPKASLQELEVVYEISAFPLCMAVFSITVAETLPVGRR